MYGDTTSHSTVNTHTHTHTNSQWTTTTSVEFYRRHTREHKGIDQSSRVCYCIASLNNQTVSVREISLSLSLSHQSSQRKNISPSVRPYASTTTTVYMWSFSNAIALCYGGNEWSIRLPVSPSAWAILERSTFPFPRLMVVQVWYGVLGFNVPLDTVYVISETGGGGPEQ